MVVWLTLEERASSVSGSPFARRLRGSCRASSGRAVAHTRVDDGSWCHRLAGLTIRGHNRRRWERWYLLTRPHSDPFM